MQTITSPRSQTQATSLSANVFARNQAHRKAEADAVAVNTMLVRRIARQLAAKLPASVDFDDLVQAGTIGLLEAFRKYDSGHGASFATFASIRIHGAMLDEIRRSDWTPRSVHRRARDAGKAKRLVEQRCGRAAGAAEVASTMALAPSEYHQMLDDAGRCRMLSLESHIEDHGVDHLAVVDSASPEQVLKQEGFRKDLSRALKTLPQREQFALTSCYLHGMSLRDIGVALGIGESRACQIVSHATRQLRAQLSDWDRSDTEN